ncbi:MAG: hypothetical protein ACREQ5_14455, partial [Candidatus Dormibacteria bacterium]
ECRAPEFRVKAMEGAEDLEVQAPKDSPAYGARNVQTVTAGTGEALPGPMTCGWCRRSGAPYNQRPWEVGGEPGGRRRRP